MPSIDPEKTPDAPRSDIAYAGVAVISRYGKRRELETMMAALDWIIDRAPETAALIVELFCDSQACASYTAKCCLDVEPCSPADVRAIADMLDQAFCTVDAGHNGIVVDPGEEAQRVDVDPWWRFEDLF